ncbi:DUF732 domain-containing protein [Rhodococcus sp. TAF43]|uniref:DUF732 domain-containing protein n=1 Tax=unclassified Rhodococcus (in: high G+C Gram-positive bacteria) TaxID=192944 RepID=UPI000E0C62CA|nr:MULTISPECIES: DUF732 domain-containing protein [unclassified Rhodococcus (in: high G+C Gram-positive bacteria)]QKT11772.1 DUF732 domain-containing protein [Rhodococcus sp. W8901]RDI17990.1 uncharacterized protein DUF732 [Rhodococcus sp. AG1013]
MIRSARFGFFSALSATALILTGCSGTPTDGEPVVIAHPTPDATTSAAPTEAVPATHATPRTSVAGPSSLPVGDSPAVVAPPERETEPNSTLTSEDILFLSYITEFTLMEKSESDQIRMGLSMCNSLYRGQSKPDLTTEYLGDGRYTTAEVTNVLGAATVAYCPDFV